MIAISHVYKHISAKCIPFISSNICNIIRLVRSTSLIKKVLELPSNESNVLMPVPTHIIVFQKYVYCINI